MSRTWRRIDEEIEATAMPEDYRYGSCAMIATTLPKFTSTLLGRNATTANHTTPARLPPQFFLNDQTFRHWFPSQEYIQSGRRSEKLAPLMNNVNGDSCMLCNTRERPMGGWRKCNPFRMLACKCQADMSHFLLQIALHSARNYEKKDSLPQLTSRRS
ncbi:CHY-type/CTCHY-type/RING-type Zinc finger protein [Prunus dulcis]|uniref:CHY-type/CTCHY-type/RING-type Zinc finger protein n=1 Tax=Prunus dulcis TaxID=3755 RepID=A0A4Y1QMY2_PRUDU|nr:CHY-type/CTCHY-type/RING-type Zinc finger protein [Prunus dulcis]